jgi:hypothetical protein
VKLALALVVLAGLLFACERVVDLTPPDASVPDAADSENIDAPPADAAVDGNDAALPPDAAVIDAS